MKVVAFVFVLLFASTHQSDAETPPDSDELSSSLDELAKIMPPSFSKGSLRGQFEAVTATDTVGSTKNFLTATRAERQELLLDEAKELTKTIGRIESFMSDDSVLKSSLPAPQRRLLSSLQVELVHAQETSNHMISMFEGVNRAKAKSESSSKEVAQVEAFRRYLSEKDETQFGDEQEQPEREFRSSSNNRSKNYRSSSWSQDSFFGGSGIHDAFNGDWSFAANYLQASPRGQKITNRSPVHPHGRDLRAGAPGQDKKDQCKLLIDCVGAMSLYDLVVFFYQDDINFEKGKFDKDITTYDEKDIAKKQYRIEDALKSARTFNQDENADYTTDEDPCDLLLEEFHITVETIFGPRSYTGNVTSVCLAQGTTQYVQIAEIEKVDPSAANTISEQLFVCASELHSNRPSEGRYANETFVFANTNGSIKLPSGIKAEGESTTRDRHGHLISTDPDDFYTYLDEAEPFNSGFFGDTGIRECVNNYVFQVYSDYLQYNVVNEMKADKPTFNLKCIWDGVPCLLGLCRASCDMTATGNVNNNGLTFPPPNCAWVVRSAGFSNDIECQGVGCDVPLPDLTSLYTAAAFDDAMTLVFGNKTSVGYLCGIKEAIVERNVNITGYCCLDTPTSSVSWGKSFTCPEDGGKTASHCESSAPYFAGLNPAACDVYAGTWCPYPQNCSALVECVDDFLNCTDVNGTASNSGFNEYLKLAPTVTDATDPEQCGKLRGFFGFSALFVNDEQICEDIEQIGSSAGSLFNGFSFGNSGGSKGDAVTLDKPESPSTSAASAKEMRRSLYVLERSVTLADFIYSAVSDLECPSPEFGVCSVVKNIAIIIANAAKVLLETIAESGNYLYGEKVDWDEFTKNELANNGKVLYDNMNKMLDVDKDTQLEVFRKPEFTQGVKFAGCDGIDQQDLNVKPHRPGYGFVDECEEDTYPPEIVMPDCLPVKLDCVSTEAVCLDKLFRNKEAAIAYLKATIGVTDDCTRQEMLDTEVSLGAVPQCGENKFTVTPISNDVCHDGADAIEGTPKYFVVGIDEEKPQVTCSFDASGTSLFERFVDERGTHMILRSSDDELKDGVFSLDVDENCDGIVSVDVLVESNEYADERMVQVVRETTIGTSPQMELFIAPTSCNDEGAPNICKKDPKTDSRLYKIHVTATDQAGHEANTTCTVIIFSGTLPNRVCQNFAVHARTAINFNGVQSTIHDGDAGVYPSTTINGAYKFDDGKIVDDSLVFADSVTAAHAAAMAVRADGKSMEIEMGGKTFTPGTYRSGSAINFALGTVVTLDGNGEFLFQAVTTLITAANTHFNLINGAKAENVIWALGTAATLGANSVLEGSILAGTAITFGTQSELHGCALAQSAVTFESEGTIKAGAPVSLDVVAEEVKRSAMNSAQRFDLASLSLEWSIKKPGLQNIMLN